MDWCWDHEIEMKGVGAAYSTDGKEEKCICKFWQEYLKEG
jgi:hypothetical protein